jgi:hypothetical protein
MRPFAGAIFRALSLLPQAGRVVALTLLASADAGALLRVIAGDFAGHTGPGPTHTPDGAQTSAFFASAWIVWFGVLRLAGVAVRRVERYR